jgi:uncharacterized protein (DUF1810 family)
MGDDPFNLQRFVDAQNPVYESVCAELRAGAKRSHWIWFIFPQIQGLGTSAMSRMFAISSADEARAYLDHRILGARLQECTQLILGIENSSLNQIFGSPDDMKFISSMTLFASVSAPGSIFSNAIDRYSPAGPDAATLERL